MYFELRMFRYFYWNTRHAEKEILFFHCDRWCLNGGALALLFVIFIFITLQTFFIRRSLLFACLLFICFCVLISNLCLSEKDKRRKHNTHPTNNWTSKMRCPTIGPMMKEWRQEGDDRIYMANKKFNISRRETLKVD